MVDRVELTTEIVAAFISNNAVPTSELPSIIESVHAAICLAAGHVEASVANQPMPAIPVRKSITPDYLICLDDGKQFKSLRRHLALLGMTPEQYRTKWQLPPTYPMVAANYAAKRSELAKSIGLGQGRQAPSAAAPPSSQRRKPGRPRKSVA